MRTSGRLMIGMAVLAGVLLGLAGCPVPPGGTGGAGAGAPPPPPKAAMVDSIKWWTSMAQALQEARDFKQPLVVDFGAEWCGFCKQLEAETFPAPEVQALKDKFVWVRVDTDKDPETARKYEVGPIPDVLVLDSNGKVLDRQLGFRPPAEMAEFLEKARAKAPQ